MGFSIQSIMDPIFRPKRYGPVLHDEDDEEKDGQTQKNTTAPTMVLESHARTARILLAAVAFLSLGWAATLIGWYKTASGISLDNGPLHVYQNTPIPKEVFLSVKKVFEPDERYVGGDHQANRHWDALVAGHDAVWIENPSKWGLPQGIVAPYDHPNTPVPKPQDFYVISILHQLHCLVSTTKNGRRAKNRVNDTPADAEETFKWRVHVEHCFEYLRQGISCGGDLIIEGNSPIKVGAGHATSVTGWGVEHDCIDFDLLRKFQIDQEAKYNETWRSG
ncbi:hypothetical protein B0H66DRAFT_484233 [Apodospora peruviana]|uniref:Uncharacterized protein n=1 Tax=Apodospora peruviana TaxID=516989 RepID=A0AAE0LZM5_9PEZI|nr:hypothetical protein B0H66DRAFT_484233 [Apodospora peruviana]